MIYFFLGEDIRSKDLKIAEIKRRLFPSREALEFDCDMLYAQKLDAETLKKVLISLPAISKGRLIVIKECHKLSAQNKELIIEFAQNPDPCTLILDSDKMEPADLFLKKLKNSVKIEYFKASEKIDVFVLTRAISVDKTIEALKILSRLLINGEQPLQIMGGLIWYWKNARERMSSKRFSEGLQALQEADLNIKRSRLKPEHALELLVVKLSGKGAG